MLEGEALIDGIRREIFGGAEINESIEDNKLHKLVRNRLVLGHIALIVALVLALIMLLYMLFVVMVAIFKDSNSLLDYIALSWLALFITYSICVIAYIEVIFIEEYKLINNIYGYYLKKPT